MGEGVQIPPLAVLIHKDLKPCHKMLLLMSHYAKATRRLADTDISPFRHNWNVAEVKVQSDICATTDNLVDLS